MEKDKEKNLGITAKKDGDFSEWYVQTILKAELVDYTSVSGCFAFRPYGYAIWEKIMREVDSKLKKMGVQNVYFPLFIPEWLLKKEQAHVKGFSPEVAWVTEAGDTKLDERLAIRPTSETIMYDSYSKWIRSWRDLPVKYNQWNNVVRWEFKHPTPLIRTREFLWCEGHSAFAARHEAEQEIKEVMDLWKDVTENLLALKGLSGKKTDAEKFAGAVASYSIEFFLPNGKAAQGPDAHFDGQNFSKAFDITFLDKNGKKEHAWQNTWAITTRMIGILAMVHGDDKGLVLPPRIAPVQIAIVPITFEKDREKVMKKAAELKASLKGFSVELDERDYTPGWKFHYWELKGVPLRIEIGARDIEKGQAVLVRRDTGEKTAVKLADIKNKAEKALEEIQKSLFEKSERFLNENIVEAKTWAKFLESIKKRKMAKAAFCGETECGEGIKEESEATSRVVSMEEKAEGKCVKCGKEAKIIAFFSKAY